MELLGVAERSDESGRENECVLFRSTVDVEECELAAITVLVFGFALALILLDFCGWVEGLALG